MKYQNVCDHPSLLENELNTESTKRGSPLDTRLKYLHEGQVPEQNVIL